ncbi:MAG: hypothetical protein Q9226_001980 [Calogaya cf. arnoldii]
MDDKADTLREPRTTDLRLPARLPQSKINCVPSTYGHLSKKLFSPQASISERPFRTHRDPATNQRPTSGFKAENTIMKIICLHGAGANSNILKTLLAPMIYELAKSDQVDFFFIDGRVGCAPAIGLAEQYDGPYYRFLNNDAPHDSQLGGLARSVSKSVAGPEDFAREMARQGMASADSSQACDYVEQQVEQHVNGPFDAVLGFSEGSSVAASLMLRRAAQGKLPLFKFAIFFCAVVPFRFNDKGLLLADERPERIEVATLHIVGARDPVRLAGVSLYNLCDQRLAAFYDHGKGHTIPWGPQTENITKWVREIMQRAQMAL